ncbi:hypothetical protein [[Clostridium] colinum]|uniref:hypothetical protein n=1 Tax=[Clostridium] colinum TaxID=36835 RepID=UPI002025052C|nr:hypothetical protein [[Clostridium] colinum]
MDGILFQSIIDFLGLKPGAIIIGILFVYLLKIIYKKYINNKRKAKKEERDFYIKIENENNSLKNVINVLSRENSTLQEENITLKYENNLLKEEFRNLEYELDKLKSLEMKGGN